MCVDYKPTRADLIANRFNCPVPEGMEWPPETWKDYMAPIIILNDEKVPEIVLASYGMVPQKKIPPQVKKYDTLNARAETIGSKRSYSKAWREARLCLIPTEIFYEPNWETGKHVRWGIKLANDEPFAVAGLWKTWNQEDGSILHSFTQLTVNADDHPLMKRFHRPGKEKRSVVILSKEDELSWLHVKDTEKEGRSFLTTYPAELLAAGPAPKPLKEQKQIEM